MAGSLSSSHMPNVEAKEAPASLVTETGSHDPAAGDDALSQAMLRVPKRVIGTHSRSKSRGSVLNNFGPIEQNYLGASLESPKLCSSIGWWPQRGL